MLQTKITKNDNKEIEKTEDGGELLHGARVLWDLVYPWAHPGQVVCADYYFASVGELEELDRIELHFIGVVKTATKNSPVISIFNQIGGCKG